MYVITLEALWATQHNISYFLLCHSRAATSDFRGSWSAALYALTLLNKGSLPYMADSGGTRKKYLKMKK